MAHVVCTSSDCARMFGVKIPSHIIYLRPGSARDSRPLSARLGFGSARGTPRGTATSTSTRTPMNVPEPFRQEL